METNDARFRDREKDYEREADIKALVGPRPGNKGERRHGSG